MVTQVNRFFLPGMYIYTYQIVTEDKNTDCGPDARRHWSPSIQNEVVANAPRLYRTPMPSLMQYTSCMELPIQLEPRDFDWRHVFGHDEFLDEVLDKHAWKVMELLFALEYAESVDGDELDLEGLWDLIGEEQNTAIEEPDQSHPALIFAEIVPETYFLTARLVQQASGILNGEAAQIAPLTDDLWHLCAQLSTAQLPMVGLASLAWEEEVDITGDLLESMECQPVLSSNSGETSPLATSPGAQRWRPLLGTAPRLAGAMMRLEDYKAAYEAFLSVNTFDPLVDELACGLFRATALAYAAVTHYCLPLTDDAGV